VLVDIGMPLLNGLEAAQRIKRILPTTKIVYVTMNQDPDLMEEAFRMGASAYLPKTSAGYELVNAIRVALAGELYLPPMFAYRTHANDELRCGLMGADGSRGLTDRQREVLQLLAEGKSMKEVAAVLNLTTRTVAFHKYRLMETLHLKNDAEVVQYAIRHRIIFS
jgi:DNA-binding NarL/FixJ family response regulator